MKQAASHLGTRRVLRALALIRQESLAVELLAKEKNVLFSGQIFFSFGAREWFGFYPADYLTSLDQEIPD